MRERPTACPVENCDLSIGCRAAATAAQEQKVQETSQPPDCPIWPAEYRLREAFGKLGVALGINPEGVVISDEPEAHVSAALAWQITLMQTIYDMDNKSK